MPSKKKMYTSTTQQIRITKEAVDLLDIPLPGIPEPVWNRLSVSMKIVTLCEMVHKLEIKSDDMGDDLHPDAQPPKDRQSRDTSHE